MLGKIYISPLIFLLIAFQTIAQTPTSESLIFSSDFEKTTFSKKFEGNEFDYFVSIEPSLNDEKVLQLVDSFDAMMEKIEKKWSRYKTDKAFLKFLFYKVHQQMLKRYTNHALVSTTLENGKYDCVTGTALYALILDRLNYDFRVRELDYHIFLEIKSADGLVVMESTDPIDGYYSSASDIKSLTEQFKKNTGTKSDAYNFINSSDNKIGLKELAGLQYYNRAIELYNEQAFNDARIAVDKAIVLYNSPRVKEIQNLISAFADSPSVAFAQED